MKIVSGDLITLAHEGRFDIMVHGCNCFCAMGAGIARQIKQHFPEAYAADLDTLAGDPVKLGNISSARIYRSGHVFTIVNAYTQFHYAGRPPLVDYQAVAQAFTKVKLCYSGMRIAYPRIGAGLGGGKWAKIADIINQALAGEDHTLVQFSTRNPADESSVPGGTKNKTCRPVDS